MQDCLHVALQSKCNALVLWSPSCAWRPPGDRSLKHNMCAAKCASNPGAGDLGGYKHRPGSRECFERGRDYLASFRLPATLVTGNHE